MSASADHTEHEEASRPIRLEKYLVGKVSQLHPTDGLSDS
jgi:hypothetical protein